MKAINNITESVTTELTPSLLWSQSKRLQAAQSNDGALRSLSSGNELMSHTPEKQKHPNSLLSN